MKTRLYNTWGKKVRREIDTAEKEKADGKDLPYNIPKKRGRRTRNGRTQYVDKEYLDFMMINRGRSIPREICDAADLQASTQTVEGRMQHRSLTSPRSLARHQTRMVRFSIVNFFCLFVFLVFSSF